MIMKILNNNFISPIIRTFIPVATLDERNDDFENDSLEGLQMFPPTKLKLFRVRFKIRLILLHTIWAALSLPARIFAVSGCIAVAYSSIYVNSLLPEIREHKEIPAYNSENLKKTNTYSMSVPDRGNEFEILSESNSEDFSLENRKSHSAEKIPFMIIRTCENIMITSDTPDHIRFSTFPEIMFNNFRFVDFSQLYNNNKPIMIPLLGGGLEARYESNEYAAGKESFTMADTISYISFLENLSILLMNKNYNDAEYLLNLLIRQRPDDENGLYYKGYIHYCRKEYSAAASYFLKSEHAKFKSFYHEARFQRAVIHYVNQQYDQATKLIESIENEGSNYSKKALALKIKITQHEPK